MTVILGRGRDVYHGNGSINWTAEKTNNHVTWAMTKVCQGLGFTDSLFLQNKGGIARAGLTGGGYGYADCGQDPDAQAKRLISLYQPVAGKNFVCLDLEKAPAAMTQADVKKWRQAYSAGIRRYAPGVFYVIYEGGYSHNGSGADIADECDAWMYPEYPGIRSFPSTFTVHVSSPNMTGKTLPEIWQCSDNIGGLDGSVSIISAAQMAGPSISNGELNVSSTEFEQLSALIKANGVFATAPSKRHNPDGTISGTPIRIVDYIASMDVNIVEPNQAVLAEFSAAVVAALPPEQTGGLTAEQVQTACVAAYKQVLTNGIGASS